MTRTLKVIFIVLGGFVLLLGEAAWMLSRVDVKSKFEAIASQATGLQVNVNGETSIKLFPMLHVSLNTVTARKNDQEIASIGVADVSAEYLPLLHKEAVLRSVRLRDVTFNLERDREGHWNIKRASSEDKTVGAVRIDHL